MSDKGQAILERHSTLKGERRTWDTLWQELADVCHPRRADITTIYPLGTPPELDNIEDSFDGTAMRSADTLARGQAARITPMGSRWFAFRPPLPLRDNSAAASWYHQAGEIVAQKLYASNFYSVQFETYQDRGVFGTAAKEIKAAKGGRGLHFREYPVGTYSIAEDDEGKVDTIFREYEFTAHQIRGAFPDATLPDAITKALTNEGERLKKWNIVHGIYPRDNYDPTKQDAKNKPWESCHVLEEGGHVLHESGFDEFPCAVSRWQRWGNSPYGWSPAYHALPEASQANYLETMLDTLAEAAAFPRVLVGDGSLKSDIDFKAMGLTFHDPAKGAPQEWLTGGRYDIGKDRANDKREAIRSAFFVDLFNPVSQLSDDATATHIRAIVSESRELFHPIFANMVREDQTPTLRRAFSLLLRSGEIPPPPASVFQEDGLGAFIAEPDVEMVSQMALALEQNHLARLNDVLTVLTPIAAADPSVLDFLDTAQLGPALSRFMGLPDSFIRTDEEIAEVQAGRAQAAQQEQALGATEAVKNLGGVDQTARLADMAAGVIPPGQ